MSMPIIGGQHLCFACNIVFLSSIGWSACSVTCGNGIKKKLDVASGNYLTELCSEPNCVIRMMIEYYSLIRSKTPVVEHKRMF